MPPKRVTLRYYATLPIVDEPEYKDGFHCDYCGTYFDSGPLYHCPATGTDGCIQCVEKKGERSGASGAQNTSTLSTANVNAKSHAPPLPCCVSVIAFPPRELFEEAGTSLQHIASNFRASSNSMTNSLFLAATERSRLVMGYMLQPNVMGALLSTGASLMVVINGSSLGPACLAVPGNDHILGCAHACTDALGLKSFIPATVPSVAPAYNTIVPILTDQLHVLFPWVGRLRQVLLNDPLRPWSYGHRESPAFIPAPGSWPPFIQLCSATNTNDGSACTSEGLFLSFVTSDGLLQVLSFCGLYELQWNSSAGGAVAAWGPKGGVPWNSESTLEARLWAAEYLKRAATIK